MGQACQEYQDNALRNLKCHRVEADEIWSVCGAKQKNAKPEKRKEGWGDLWTWVSICADSRLVINWHVGRRTTKDALIFIYELRARVAGRIELNTDGLHSYSYAVEQVFGENVDFAQLIKIYGPLPDGQQARYSPPPCIGTRRITKSGNPDLEKLSTSYVERQNLTLRMQCRRFTRLTNAHSKKVENHKHGLAMHYMFQNFCKINSTLRVTPAMEAGLTDHVWELEEVVALLGQKPIEKVA
jgi:IS1 family transposase